MKIEHGSSGAGRCIGCSIAVKEDGYIYLCPVFNRALFRRGGRSQDGVKSCRQLMSEYSEWYRAANEMEKR